MINRNFRRLWVLTLNLNLLSFTTVSKLTYTSYWITKITFLFSILTSLSKTYLNWNTSLTNSHENEIFLKHWKCWIYWSLLSIIKKFPNDILIKKTRMFKRDHKKVVIIMKMHYRNHICKLIKNCINAAKAYKIFKKNFIFKDVNIVNDVFHKFFNLRLKNYFSIDVYVNKFRNTINELKILSFKMIFNDNFLIY